MVNIVRFIGVGASFGMVFDDLFDYASASYLTFGVVGRPRFNLELGIMLGFTLTGTIWTDSGVGEVSGLNPYFTFPADYQVWFGWRIRDDLMIQAKYVGTTLGGFENQLPGGYIYPYSDYEFTTGRFTISALYSFAIGSGRRR